MAQTTTTTLATTLPTEFIAAEVIREARPFNVVAPHVINDVLPAGQGKVWAMQKLPATTAAAVAEASDIAAVARTTTEATVTVSEVGLSTEITRLALETSRLEDQLLMWGASQGRAIAQKVTADLCALFPALNGSTAVGSSGTDITVANFIEAMYTLDNANAPGAKVCVLHPQQVSDLFTAIVGAGGAVYHNLPELIRGGRLPEGQPEAGFVGMLFGVPIYSTTEVTSVNSDADRCGAMFTREALAFIQLRPITVEYDYDASGRATEVVVTTAYGVGEVVDGYGVPIETDA
jgi:hypothetical protein